MSTPLRAFAGLGLGLLTLPAPAHSQERMDKVFRVRVGPTVGATFPLVGRSSIFPTTGAGASTYGLRFPTGGREVLALGGLIDAGTRIASVQFQFEYRSYGQGDIITLDPTPPPANGTYSYYDTDEEAGGAPASAVVGLRFEVRPLMLGPVRLSAAVGAERLLSRRKTAGLAAVGFRLPSGAGVFFFETSLERYHVNYSRVDLVFQNGSIVSETVGNRGAAINAGSIRLGFLVGRP